eukprot:scaffold186634_cov37-Prasinocladus_malaysianus.AAC.1
MHGWMGAPACIGERERCTAALLRWNSGQTRNQSVEMHYHAVDMPRDSYTARLKVSIYADCRSSRSMLCHCWCIERTLGRQQAERSAGCCLLKRIANG